MSNTSDQASQDRRTLTPSAEATKESVTSTPVADEGAESNARAAEVDVYDPKRDPQEDLQKAIQAAQQSKKHILLEVGGDWCVWCHKMDAFYEKHPELLELREQHYILVKINMSTENENKTFLGQYPDVAGYPHIFVLDSNGKLLHSENTAELEQGASYHLERFTVFLEKWKPESRN